MARTRSSQEPSSSPAGKKRSAPPSAQSSPAPKRGKKTPKEQKTIEETLNGGDDKEGEKLNGKENGEKAGDSSMKGVENGKVTEKSNGQENGEKNGDEAGDVSMNGVEDDHEIEKQINEAENESEKEAQNGHAGAEKAKQNGEKGDTSKEGEKNAFDEVKSDEAEVKNTAREEQETKAADISKNNESIVEDDKREAEIPSSILEKGIIYFFFRGRVGVEDPQGIEDVARSYIILRPIPKGASLGEGPLEDLGTSRLIALPKKMMPKSTKDKFLVFVEKPKASIKELREQFESNDYSTKTSGTSHVPSATPFAEGVYAITTTGRESHLVYEITAPKIGDLQKDLGVNEKGSYVLSVKNPKAPSPANASIDNPAKYPEEIQAKFRELRWSPLEPEMLDYEGTQVLIIGEGIGVLGRAVEELSKDQKDDSKVKPEEELDNLEEEDHKRVDHLKEADPVFADLGLSAKEYEKMSSTW